MQDFFLETIATSMVSGFVTSLYFNKNVELFNVNKSLYNRRNKVFNKIKSFFPDIYIINKTKNIKLPISKEEFTSDLELIRIESSRIFPPRAYYKILKILFFIECCISEKKTNDPVIFTFCTKEEFTEIVHSTIYSNKKIEKFYLDKIVSEEKILNLNKMSSVISYLWNYKLLYIFYYINIKIKERKLIESRYYYYHEGKFVSKKPNISKIYKSIEKFFSKDE